MSPTDDRRSPAEIDAAEDRARVERTAEDDADRRSKGDRERDAGSGSNDGERPDWAAMAVDKVIDELETSKNGLDADEAKRRLEQYGRNRLAKTVKRGPLKRFSAQFDNLLIYVLLAAAALAVLIGHAIDALVILAVVMVNTAIGFFQEGKAEDALEAIRGMIDPEATVRRGGAKTRVPADQVVPGDLVLIESGDRVPADLRLIRAKNLKLDEAALTGESVPVDKHIEAIEPGADLGDRTSMAFSGTFVAAGQGAGIVVATATETELGRISGMLSEVVELRTPLIRQMDQFARQITFAVMAAAGLVFVFAYFLQGFALVEAFMAVVGLFVAAIPEGLPAVMTVTLAIGVQRMAGRKAIIRRLPAVETLGAVSVICSDKTGTLTRNEMTVRSIATASGIVEVSGTGYAPEGGFARGGAPLDPAADPLLEALLEVAILCNDAEIREQDGQWQAAGDPMEAALTALAMKAGHDPAERREAQARLDEIPFDSAHKFMATLHDGHVGHDGHRGHAILVKGAPERLIELAGEVQGEAGPEAIDRDVWLERVGELAARGERVLGFAIKRVGTDHASLEHGHLEEGLVLLGLMGFIDPPRGEAIEAVEACKTAGIRVVMITGDHALTARAIAAQLGLADDPRVLTGRDLEDMDDAALKRAALATQVFARTTPEHKLRLVQALQADGLTVAMTGDGVNDAPALKRADVGVAMGRKGTEAAKEAAEMVLADDNFASIVAAVREGRTVYDNLKKTILFLLPINGGESMTIVFAILAGLELPITPVQILWVNMVSSVALAMVLAFEPTEPGTMQQKPRPAREPLLRGDVVWRIVFIACLFLIGAFGMFAWAIERGLPLEVARTMVVNTIVVMEIFYLFSVRYTYGASLTWKGLFGTPAVLAGITAVVLLQLVFTYAPFMALPFDTAPVALADGFVIVGIGAVLFVVVEIEKRIRLGWRNRRSGRKARATEYHQKGHPPMMHVDIPTQAEIKALAESRSEICASLYLPTSPLSQAAAEHDRLTLKNLAFDATRQMEAAGVNKRLIWPITEQLEDLVDDDDFWQVQARSLAVFVTPDAIRTFRLPNNLEQVAQVSDRFFLKPLLRSVTFPHEALVLSLSVGQARLVEVFADLPPQDVRVPGMPKDAMSAVGKATIGHRSPSGRIHGSEGEKVRMRQYARAVDQALRGLLAGRNTPMILAVTRPLDDIFRSVNTYPHLATQQITASADELTNSQLAEAARPLLDEIYAEEMAAQMELFRARKAQGRATTDLAQAAKAATFGAIDSLLVDIDEVVPGWVDETDGSIRFAEGSDTTSYGIVDEIAARTIAHGGRVLGVRKSDLPDNTHLAAILRYAI